MEMTAFQKKVLEYLLTVPDGKVVTYGQVAEGIGAGGGARAVGNALHRNPDPEYYPCYKVVNSQGALAKHFALGMEEQRRRLIQSGVEVVNGRVDLKVYGYGRSGAILSA